MSPKTEYIVLRLLSYYIRARPNYDQNPILQDLERTTLLNSIVTSDLVIPDAVSYPSFVIRMHSVVSNRISVSELMQSTC